MARAAASNGGPRFAEVAGSAKCKEGAALLCFFFLGIGTRAVGFLCLLQSSDHSVQSGIQHHRRMAQGLQLYVFGSMTDILQESSAMEVDGKVWILEQVSSQNQDDGLFRRHKTLLL